MCVCVCVCVAAAGGQQAGRDATAARAEQERVRDCQERRVQPRPRALRHLVCAGRERHRAHLPPQVARQRFSQRLQQVDYLCAVVVVLCCCCFINDDENIKDTRKSTSRT